MKQLADYIITIPDFPKEGILFRDITNVVEQADGLRLAIDGFIKELEDVDFDYVIGPEARGFIFGVPVAYAMGKGFIPVRKEGKLPGKTASMSYELEYGIATLEIHRRSIKPGDKVVIVDDLLATGGTTEAIIRLVEDLGGQVVRCCFLIELKGLKGRDKLPGTSVRTLVAYEGA
ncbi:MAG: adenine phosphoribosyltransferase [Eubacteriales bacterium]|nr:adenine phosphoribosyltransferase [Eubacteriales bacterium]